MTDTNPEPAADILAELAEALEPLAKAADSHAANCRRAGVAEMPEDNVILLGITSGHLRRAQEALAKYRRQS